jgi:hypothetical protein
MLEQPISALFFRSIPESILLCYASYIIINSRVDMKKTVYSGIILGLISYLVRLLPINFGVHTIIGVLIYASLLSKIHNMAIFKSMKVSLVAMVILLISDTITVYTCINILKIPQEVLLQQNTQGILIGSLSFVIFIPIIMAIKLIQKNKSKIELLQEKSNL